MVMASCTTCSREIAKDASSCPHCGQPNPTLKAGTRLVLTFIVLGLFSWWFFGNGLTSHAQDQMIEQALAEYQIAWRSNDRMQTCAHAGIVAAIYLQAKDETNYNNWLSIEKKECKAAGVPR